MRGIAAVLLLSALPVSGCGSGDSLSASEEVWCREHVALGVHLASIGSLQGDAYAGDPSQVEARLSAIDDSIAAARKVVPSEIADDFEATTAPYVVLHDAFADVGYKFSDLTPDALSQISAAFTDSQAALDRYGTYVDDACSGSVTCAATFKTVEVAIQAYQAKEGKLPPDAQALVTAGFLRELPSEVKVVDGVYTMAPNADCF